jgi:cysteine synthase
MSLPVLPTLEELLHPERQPGEIRQKAHSCEDPLDPVNLFNISWRDKTGHIPHVVLPQALTGVPCNIVVMSARHFPSGSHKVGPAFSCLREAILDRGVTTEGKTLVFPSTGNYGIGGAWVGPRVGFRSLVVLPEEMSAERFEKIRGYGAEVIATPGCESNVKEIYDKVGELRADENNVILNQFEEFGNYRFHYHVTGGSARELAQELQTHDIGDGRVAAFVSAMGSAGTSAATDHLKVQFPECRAVAVEPVQCPTLYNVGYGGHAIEGIGDKHVTWIHNVRNTDLLVCIDDQETLRGMQLLQEGRDVLQKELGLDDEFLASIDNMFGPSGVCNVIAAIKSAKHWELEAGQNVFTVATDGFDRYPSVVKHLVEREGPQTDEVAKARIELFRGADTTWVQDGTPAARRRWHNQKYFTWVEQQGKSVDELNALWEPSFWRDQAALIPEYDERVLALRDA